MTGGIYITCAFSLYINEFTINRYLAANFHACTSASLSYPEIHSVNFKALDIFTYAGWVESRWTYLMPPLHATIT